jgi:hypothetical protein
VSLVFTVTNEDERLRALSLADRLRIAAVDLAATGAPRALVEAVWLASEEEASR